MARFTIHRVNSDEYGSTAESTGMTINADTEFGAAQALLASAEHFGYGTLEARTPAGTVAARVTAEVFETEIEVPA